jgi:hypothetical protein
MSHVSTVDLHALYASRAIAKTRAFLHRAINPGAAAAAAAGGSNASGSSGGGGGGSAAAGGGGGGGGGGQNSAGHHNGHASSSSGLSKSPNTNASGWGGGGGGGNGAQSLADRAVVVAEINRRDHLGRTVLHLAVVEQDPWALDWVELLLAVPGCAVNLQDTESGWSALHRALYSGVSRPGRLFRARAARKEAKQTAELFLFDRTLPPLDCSFAATISIPASKTTKASRRLTSSTRPSTGPTRSPTRSAPTLPTPAESNSSRGVRTATTRSGSRVIANARSLNGST